MIPKPVETKDISKQSIRVAFGDGVTTIVKTVGRENRTISLTDEERQYLLDELFKNTQPWSPSA